DILTDIRHVDCTRHMIDNPEPCNFVNCSVLSCTEHLLVLLLFLIRRVSSKDHTAFIRHTLFLHLVREAPPARHIQSDDRPLFLDEPPNPLPAGYETHLLQLHEGIPDHDTLHLVFISKCMFTWQFIPRLQLIGQNLLLYRIPDDTFTGNTEITLFHIFPPHSN